MKRWNNDKNENGENEAIDKFLEEIAEVCKKHGLSLSHEDHYGAFEVEEFSQSNIDWILEAHDATKEVEPTFEAN